jgi:hypothetical protein
MLGSEPLYSVVLAYSVGVWFVLAIMTAIAADQRGRNAIVWFVLAFIIAPPFVLLALIAMPAEADSSLDVLAMHRGPSAQHVH